MIKSIHIAIVGRSKETRTKNFHRYAVRGGKGKLFVKNKARGREREISRGYRDISYLKKSINILCSVTRQGGQRHASVSE